MNQIVCKVHEYAIDAADVAKNGKINLKLSKSKLYGKYCFCLP